MGPKISRQVKKVPPLCTRKVVRIHLHLQCHLYLQEVTHVTSGILPVQMNREQGWSVTSRRQRTRWHVHWLIKHRTNQNGATEFGWWHIMIRDRGFVKTRGITQTLITRKPHDCSFCDFLSWKFKGLVHTIHKKTFSHLYLVALNLAMQNDLILCSQAHRYLPFKILLPPPPKKLNKSFH